MAIIFVEGFDHLTASQMSSKGWATNPSSMQPGQFDGQCARSASATGLKVKQLPSTYSTLIVGFAYRASNVTQTGTFYAIRAVGTSILQLQLNASSNLVVKNSAGTTIATGTTTLSANAWYYIEIKLVVGTSGTVEVHLNGVTEIASTVGNFGTTNVDNLGYASNGASTNADFDDMYAADTTGSAPQNTFLGVVRVETIYPNGAGTHTAWTANGAATNFGCVDEAQADDDITYISDATPGDIDTYAFGDIDGGATVYALQTNLYARKDDANTRQIAPVIRQSSTDNVGTTVTLGSTYLTYSQIYNQDPTSANWTPTVVNGDEFGVKEIA